MKSGHHIENQQTNPWASRALLAALGLLAGCGINPLLEREAPRPQTQGILPMRFVLAADAPEWVGQGSEAFRVVDALQQAAHVWNQASGLRLIEFASTRSSKTSATFALDQTSRDGVNGLYIFEDFGNTQDTLGAEAPTDILGLCVSRGFEADIALTLMARVRRTSNGIEVEREVRAADLTLHHRSVEASLWASETRRRSANSFDFVSVAIHEFGHALGLPHDTTDEQSVMWHEGLAVGRLNRGLSASDKSRLAWVLEQRFGLKTEIEATTDTESLRN